jgi:hypothetical protein
MVAASKVRGKGGRGAAAAKEEKEAAVAGAGEGDGGGERLAAAGEELGGAPSNYSQAREVGV